MSLPPGFPWKCSPLGPVVKMVGGRDRFFLICAALRRGALYRHSLWRGLRHNECQARPRDRDLRAGAAGENTGGYTGATRN